LHRRRKEEALGKVSIGHEERKDNGTRNIGKNSHVALYTYIHTDNILFEKNSNVWKERKEGREFF
jgi:hypothetical protein